MDKKVLMDMERQIKERIPYATPEEMKAMGYVWNEKAKAWKKEGGEKIK